MTEAETITRLRTLLAERDAEIRRLRREVSKAVWFEVDLSAPGSPLPDLPDGSRMTITFPARPHDQS